MPRPFIHAPALLLLRTGSGEREGSDGAFGRDPRAQVCCQAAWLGLELDAAANERRSPCLSTPASKITAWMLPTDEDLTIARHALERVMHSSDSQGLAQD